MIEPLHMKLLDPDEKVRLAVCKVYSQLDYEMALHHATEAQLRAVAGRGLDKKVVGFASIVWIAAYADTPTITECGEGGSSERYWEAV